MEHEARVQALRGTEFFSRLSPGTLDRVAAQSAVREHAPDDLLCREGEQAESLLVLVTGRASVFCTSPQGMRVGLGILSAPDVHLEMSVLDGSARASSVQGLGPCTCLRLPRVHLLGLLVTERQLLEPVAHLLGQLVRGLTGRVVDQVALDLPGRVAKQLLQLAEGRRTVNVTQRQLAELVGGTRQSVNQVLGELATSGMVQLDRSRVVLCDPERLAVLAQLPREGATGPPHGRRPARPAVVAPAQRRPVPALYPGEPAPVRAALRPGRAAG